MFYKYSCLIYRLNIVNFYYYISYYAISLFINKYVIYILILLCKGKLTKAWGLGGLDNPHSKLL